jgi:ATP-dependent DNA ligase
MLARLARELPTGPGWRYEPKWDGFRCLAFRDGEEVDLRSRHGRPFARYFPEVVEAMRRLPAPTFVLDGELLADRGGQPDFAALLERLHPAASRVARLAVETPATFAAFDLLADATDRTGLAYDDRRGLLERLDLRPPLALTPVTGDPATARRWLARQPGVDGVLAKRAESAYLPGRREWVKVKLERTADCVVAGFRVRAGGRTVSSVLLGVYADGALVHVGAVSAFDRSARADVTRTVAPLAAPLAGHPWEQGFALEGGAVGRLRGSAGRWAPGMTMDWVPVRPELVCEVGYDALDGLRFRHPARFRRWRPDRVPSSCTTDQLQ